MNRIKKIERIPLCKRAIKNGDFDLLYIDSETSLCKAVVWGTGEQYISEDNIESGNKVIVIQWMFESDQVPRYVTWDENQDDSKALDYFINSVLNEHPNAVVIGHNHKKFDFKILNDRAKDLKLNPIESSIRIDTLQSSRGAFKALSHKLDYKSRLYGLGGKIVTKMQLWKDVLNNDKQALDTMVKYGVKDVTDLREVFWRELPYYDSIPADLERLLLGVKAKCSRCEENKKGKYDIEECKVKGRKGWLCLNCGDRFVV